MVEMIWLTFWSGMLVPRFFARNQSDSTFRSYRRFDGNVPVTLVGLAIGRVALIRVDSNDHSARVTLQIDQAQDNLPQAIVQRC